MISRERLHQEKKRWIRRVKALFAWKRVIDGGRWGDVDLRDWVYIRKQGKPCSCYMCGNERKWFGIERIRDRRRDGGLDG